MARKPQWGNFTRFVSQHNEENYNEVESYHDEYTGLSHGGLSRLKHETSSGANNVVWNSSHGTVSIGSHSNNVNSGNNDLLGGREAHGGYRVETIINSTVHPSQIAQNDAMSNLNDQNEIVTEVPIIQRGTTGIENDGVKDESEAVKEIISSVWEEIDESIPVYEKRYKERDYPVKKGWKVIRIFISSTFTDFFAERELIVKKVIPELREWADEKQVHIYECDLRWGVPKNTRFDDTIGMMMDEIDRCIKDTNGHPFFVCLLGERYGWVPTRQYVSNDIIDDYGWVYPTSMTHMEVIHGALRTMSPNAMFMIRDKESIDGLPQQFKRDFYDRSPLATESMKRLKEELHERFPGQTFCYKATLSGVDEENGKVSFKDLDDFQIQMVDFFKNKIDEYLQQFAIDNITSSVTKDEMKVQDIFIQKRGEILIGREEELDMLTEFLNVDEKEIGTAETAISTAVETAVGDAKTTENQTESINLTGTVSDESKNAIKEDEKKRMCFIIAERGTGKASLLANFVLKLKKNGIPCLWNFTGSSPDSTDSVAVLRRFCEQLASLLGEPDLPAASENIYHDYDDLKVQFHDLLLNISQRYPGFPIILHSIHDFQDSWGASGDWFPIPSVELNIRYVISLVPDYGNDYLILTEKFQKVSKKVMLPGLDVPERKEFVHVYFDAFNKRLDGEQCKELISREGSGSPQWLSLACNEIRIFGVYENLTFFIRSLPGFVPELLKSIFKRIVKEDGTKKFADALCCISCSDFGLTEGELRSLVSEIEMEQLPMLTWLQVFRELKYFVRNTSAAQIRMYTVSNVFVKQVVNEMFMETDVEKKFWHRKLANYFLQEGKCHFRTANTILWHLKHAEMGNEMMEFFQKDKRSLRITSVKRYLALSKFRCNTRMYGNHREKQLYFCASCNIRKLSQRHVDGCYVCGKFIPLFHRNDSRFCSQASLCSKHCSYFAPTMTDCYFCGVKLFINQPMFMNRPKPQVMNQQRPQIPAMYYPLLCCDLCKGVCVAIA